MSGVYFFIRKSHFPIWVIQHWIKCWIGSTRKMYLLNKSILQTELYFNQHIILKILKSSLVKSIWYHRMWRTYVFILHRRHPTMIWVIRRRRRWQPSGTPQHLAMLDTRSHRTAGSHELTTMRRRYRRRCHSKPAHWRRVTKRSPYSLVLRHPTSLLQRSIPLHLITSLEPCIR